MEMLIGQFRTMQHQISHLNTLSFLETSYQFKIKKPKNIQDGLSPTLLTKTAVPKQLQNHLFSKLMVSVMKHQNPMFGVTTHSHRLALLKLPTLVRVVASLSTEMLSLMPSNHILEFS